MASTSLRPPRSYLCAKVPRVIHERQINAVGYSNQHKELVTAMGTVHGHAGSQPANKGDMGHLRVSLERSHDHGRSALKPASQKPKVSALAQSQHAEENHASSCNNPFCQYQFLHNPNTAESGKKRNFKDRTPLKNHGWQGLSDEGKKLATAYTKQDEVYR
ncbi:hypothetical protein H2198_002481 [Neophaeococcomyces mojaviensis]|uniref:Uncharacterized protein n=1 Tax=Neophaeococcomyces mojaviensis TaxID=3383035 RepID=A0ACC3ADZ5_9EURO|nr:hypothetical protein H2198_002481 [Knufia sp. JES_112]